MSEARFVVDPSAGSAPIDRRLFGSFVEHLGRGIYTGIHEPGHPAADDLGFRQDVLDLVRELGVTTVRYPGGNFVSSYRWEDGVGPVESRPRRLDPSWHSLEPNTIGLDEFARWCTRANVELMLAVNLGTRGIEEALDLLEYANVPGGSTLSDARVANGTPEPHAVRMWCLGNEMDGTWQTGHRSAEDYGVLAGRTARAMRQIDERLELVVCGSSFRAMPTFGAWERTVLEHTWDAIDHISCHAYYSDKSHDLPEFLASPVDMDRFIDEVAATIDHVAALKRSDKKIGISFDEWNVWDVERYEQQDKRHDIDDWPIAPRLLEDSYTVADAVVVGGLLMSLLRHADRVRAASLAQLVNVIAPIMTEPGGPAWRQTSFFPFAVTARLTGPDARAVPVMVDAPHYDTTAHGSVPLVDAVAVVDDETTTVFLVNRSPDTAIDVAAELRGRGTVVESVGIWDADPMARNTLDDRERVGLQQLPATLTDGMLTATLPPVCWVAIQTR
ncbi:alpha-N-arabinofuranosidase [Pseudolysinimonas sp.]|uniref:arabinosylfuranosidase ArfA n=1 Tax=Pseudolysinimonas sp. TaxID=2680009 RepID=UPI003783E47B